jgi:hypothetical protein
MLSITVGVLIFAAVFPDSCHNKNYRLQSIRVSCHDIRSIIIMCMKLHAL